MTGEENKRIHRGLTGVYFDKTSITDIQGDNGCLIHRGYSIEDLSIDPRYERISHLLINGRMPNKDEELSLQKKLTKHRYLQNDVVDLLEKMKGKRPDIALRTAISFLGDRRGGPSDEEDWSLIGMMPSIVIAHHALRRDQAIPDPHSDDDLASDFLSRLLQRPLTDLEKRIINLDFVLHADHGANASAFVARIAVSTEGDVSGAIAAAIATFAGRLHGGAVAGVAQMLDELGTADAARRFAEGYRLGSDPIMGFGHRVYRVEDPRAKLFRKAASDLSEDRGDRRLFETLEALVEGMEPYRHFGISPNVDLYAAVIYRLLGLPDDLSTAIFATARSAGWIAQIREQKSNNILIRPRLLYEGE
ncbi:MAG: citrate/2-methylcitrate synthase [Geminicoccales bacterium]